MGVFRLFALDCLSWLSRRCGCARRCEAVRCRERTIALQARELHQCRTGDVRFTYLRRGRCDACGQWRRIYAGWLDGANRCLPCLCDFIQSRHADDEVQG